MQTRYKRKRNDVTYYPNKRYVFAQYWKPIPIPTTYTEKEIVAGLESNEIITLDAWKQRRPVYELDGQLVPEEELANTKKIAKMKANGKIISATTYRNRLLRLHSMSINKITNYDQAFQIARELIKSLPAPICLKRSHFFVQEEMMKHLSSLPTALWNKMGIVSVRKATVLYRVNIEFDRYKKWHRGDTYYTPKKLPPILPIQLPKDKNHQATTDEVKNTPLQALSFFSNTLISQRDYSVPDNILEAEIAFTDLLGDGNPGEMLGEFSFTPPTLFSEAILEEQDTEYRKQMNP